MVSWGIGSGTLWVVIIVVGLGTYAMRLSFVQLYSQMDDFPPRVERALAFIPVAILAALIFPELFSLDGPVVSVVIDARVLAGGLAAIIAWRTGSMLATIGVGMSTLWIIKLLFG